MPFKAPPMTDLCEKCSWKQTIIPTSDVVLRMPCCPKCGNGSLVHRIATKTETLAAKLSYLFKRR